MADLFSELGNLASDNGEWEKAEVYYLKSIEMSHKLGDVLASTIHQFNLGLMHDTIDLKNKVIILMTKAVEMAQSQNFYEADRWAAILQEILDE